MPKKAKKSKNVKKNRRPLSKDGMQTELQIIGGKFRGRKLIHLAREGTRPMKHRVREAIFNLVGMECNGKHVIDMFAGTGAIGLEALSRGATTATFIERHVPTSHTIRENIEQLGLQTRAELLITSAFLWQKRDLPQCAAGLSSLSATQKGGIDPTRPWIGAGRPWILFCSPPYQFFIDRWDEMRSLLEAFLEFAPKGSTLVVEMDDQFDVSLLPNVWNNKNTGKPEQAEWDIRTYYPAVVGVLRSVEVD